MGRCFSAASAATVAACLLLLATLGGAEASGVYDTTNDHWTYSTALNDATIDDFIQSGIDMQQTVFVRFIASPISNSAGKVENDNTTVKLIKFGDVNLQDEGNDALYGDPHNPGAGGWPTIRYFTPDTGVRGQSYVKKTDLSVCDELGPDHLDNMIDFVEEAARTSLCSESHVQNCDERSLAFLHKMQAQDVASWETQVARLQGLLDKGKIKAELKDWMIRRKRILQSLIKSDGTTTISSSETTDEVGLDNKGETKSEPQRETIRRGTWCWLVMMLYGTMKGLCMIVPRARFLQLRQEIQQKRVRVLFLE